MGQSHQIWVKVPRGRATRALQWRVNGGQGSGVGEFYQWCGLNRAKRWAKAVACPALSLQIFGEMRWGDRCAQEPRLHEESGWNTFAGNELRQDLRRSHARLVIFRSPNSYSATYPQASLPSQLPGSPK